MTINNCNINPYPTSNPYTSRFYGNNNVMWNQTGFKRCSQNTPVPKSKPFTMEAKQYWDNVSVPNGEVVPMGAEGNISMLPQFNDDLFQCPDGTLISKSTGKILRDNTKNTDFPNSKMRTIGKNIENTWDDRKIYDFSSSRQKETEIGLSKSDIEYAEISKRENEKLKNNMTDLQKQLLSDLESGKMLKLSKLTEEK